EIGEFFCARGAVVQVRLEAARFVRRRLFVKVRDQRFPHAASRGLIGFAHLATTHFLLMIPTCIQIGPARASRQLARLSFQLLPHSSLDHSLLITLSCHLSLRWRRADAPAVF